MRSEVYGRLSVFVCLSVYTATAAQGSIRVSSKVTICGFAASFELELGLLIVAFSEQLGSM